MSEMKMSDVFELPMTQGITCVMSKDHRHEIVFDESDSNVSDQIEHVAHAINNHDRMAEEIAELKGALFEIRSVSMRTPELKDDYTHEDVGILDDRINEAFGIAETALAKLNQEGEE